MADIRNISKKKKKTFLPQEKVPHGWSSIRERADIMPNR